MPTTELKKSKKDSLRTGISVILSFLLSLCLTLLIALLCLNFTAFRANALIGDMDDSFFRQTRESLVENLQTLLPPTGLPDTIFDDLFTVSSIKKDAVQAVRNTLGGVADPVDTSAVRQQLMDRFTNYADSRGIDVQATNLSSLADACVQAYQKQISLSYLSSYASFRLMFDKIFTFAVIGLSVLGIAVLLLLFRIHPFKHRALRFTIYSLLASALMTVPFPLVLLLRGQYRYFSIQPEQFHLLFITFVRKSLLGLVIGGAAAGLLGLALLPLVGHMKDQLTAGGHSHRR